MSRDSNVCEPRTRGELHSVAVTVVSREEFLAAPDQRHNLQLIARFQNACRVLCPRDEIPVPLDGDVPRLETQLFQERGDGCSP